MELTRETTCQLREHGMHKEDCEAMEMFGVQEGSKGSFTCPLLLGIHHKKVDKGCEL